MDLVSKLGEGSPDVSELLALIRSSADICMTPLLEDGSYALHLACRNAKVLAMEAVIRMLVETHRDALLESNKFGFTPLHRAVSVAQDEHLPILRLLIDLAPESLSMQTIDGQSIFHLAVTGPRNPSKAIVEFLCSRHPEGLNIFDAYGQLPLHKAVAKPRIDADIVTVLLHWGGDAVSVKDGRGYATELLLYTL